VGRRGVEGKWRGGKVRERRGGKVGSSVHPVEKHSLHIKVYQHYY